MVSKQWLLFIFLYSIVSACSADIIGDLLGWTSDDDGLPGKRDENDEGEISSCNCLNEICDCCVHFNLTSVVDLGGPGCVRMRYLGQDKGVAVNITYGESLLHTDKIGPGGKKASCLNLISSFAQVCAKFERLEKSNDGLSGCINFYPTILGAISDNYDIGCFRMGPHGMTQDFTRNETEATTEGSEDNEAESGDEEPTFGIVQTFIEDFLGFKSPSSGQKPTKITSTEKPAEGEEEDKEEDAETEEEQEERRLSRHQRPL